MPVVPLPASANSEREAVEREVCELERLCGALESSLVAGDWNGAANALRDSRRVTHAFVNAMEEAAAARDQEFDRAIEVRVRRVYDAREDQLERLRAFHTQIGERLATISRWKSFARSIGAKKARARHSLFDSTR